MPSVAECKNFLDEYIEGVVFHIPKKISDKEEYITWSNEINTKLLNVDCCCFFSDRASEPADKGVSIEKTDLDSCIGCGLCVDVCYFKARKMEDGNLTIEREACYGCGLCVDVCPVNCITMEERISG
jgi:ferredoxin